MDDLLFYCGGELRHALEAQGQKMRQAIEAEPDDNLKQADVDEWAASLAHHFDKTNARARPRGAACGHKGNVALGLVPCDCDSMREM